MEDSVAIHIPAATLIKVLKQELGESSFSSPPAMLQTRPNLRF